MKISKFLLILCVGLVSLLVVGEILVRVVISPPLHPNRAFTLQNQVPGMHEEVKFEIDPNQLRWWNWKGEKPAGSLTVLCLGGGASTSMFQNPEDTWWGQLGQDLESALGKPVQVACVTAQSAGTIIGGAQWADHLLSELDGVDLVIPMYGLGELLWPKADFKFDPNAIRPIAFGESGGVGLKLAKTSQLLRLVRNGRKGSQRDVLQREYGKLNFLRDRVEAAQRAYQSVAPSTMNPPRKGDPIDAYLHGVGMFIDLAKRHRVKLLVAGEPTIFSALISPDAEKVLYSVVHVGPGESDYSRPDPSWVDSELGRYYAAASRLCAASDIPFTNLQGAVLPARENFFTEVLLTDLGAAQAADLLLPAVERALE